MSESDKEEISEELEHFFQGKHFKFEGLTIETEEKFTRLVKAMGAEVSDDANFTFMQKSYFEKKKNSTKGILCNNDWIVDSIKRGAPLNLDDYMFIPNCDEQLSDDEPLCYAARNLYKTDSCQECYYTRVFCQECAKQSINGSLKAMDQDTNDIESATGKSSESIDDTVNSPEEKVVEPSVKALKRHCLSDSRQDPSDEEIFKFTCSKKTFVPKKFKISSQIVNTASREDSSGSEVEIYRDSNSVDDSNISQNKHVKKAKIEITSEVIELSDSDSDTEIQSSKSSCKQVKRVSIIDWLVSSTSKTPIQIKNPAAVQSKPESRSSLNIVNDDNVEKRYFKAEKWWITRQDIPANEKCTFISCPFEPMDHPKHYRSQKWLSLIEKKILVKYFIIHNSIASAKGKSAYEKMRKDGYLTNRSGETLRNCFRRTILNEIESYNLEKFHFDEFLKLRVKKITKENKNK